MCGPGLSDTGNCPSGSSCKTGEKEHATRAMTRRQLDVVSRTKLAHGNPSAILEGMEPAAKAEIVLNQKETTG
jgi:hypothetical protein